MPPVAPGEPPSLAAASQPAARPKPSPTPRPTPKARPLATSPQATAKSPARKTPKASPKPRAAVSYGPGSAAPLPDGSAPGPEYTIKGNAQSKLFHPPSSPYFGRTRAEVWFRTAQDAEAAGFTAYTPRRRGTS
ncbi:hypothetical protein [Pseudonocardia broussonetiae]|uniref:Uncharacterized protein n=1 Tax=Pseudonocardia broussonetiae TaxID=2736640 RepID=A0A6M6JFF5_9PSEU|nr:hypothetical protein [Pseudonocardia broussonetiae]QJY45221.1 hypothetical protein HOP40_04755 [Pseudonocardia broussonetiae]